MKIGIFGGCFNPPHKKHISIALDLLNEGMVDKVIYVPTGNTYKKENLIDIKHRINMLNMLIKNNPKIEISTIASEECFQYTYQTLDKIREKNKNDTLYFICGSDNLEELDTWKEYEYILKNYKILVIKRNNSNINQLIEKYKSFEKNIIVSNVKTETISSTMIRTFIKKENKQEILKYIPEEIYEYIIKEELYKEQKMDKVIKKLTEANKTISTMESCTGGCLADAITNIEGASDVIKFSAVTYSNEFKVKMGVPKDTIDKYSVYSKETAIEMSKKISEFTDSNYGVGITGKLNRVDKNNLGGKDNCVFISIFNKDIDKVYNYVLDVEKTSRKENKKDIIEFITEKLLEIVK